MISFIFSPTGGTKRVAEALTAGHDAVQTVDLASPREQGAWRLSQNDIAILAVPSYGGRVPRLAAEKMRRIQANQAQCILVCVYGNRAYDDTLAELEDIARSCGFRVVAAVAAWRRKPVRRAPRAGYAPGSVRREPLTGRGQRTLTRRSVFLVCTVLRSVLKAQKRLIRLCSAPWQKSWGRFAQAEKQTSFFFNRRSNDFA